jgi:hypothetical protein
MFYTYVWLRSDGSPYYVGKGTGIRAYRKHRVGSAPPLGRIVFYIAKDESEAFEIEVALIWYYGRKDLGLGLLRNLTDGGENPPKVNCTGMKRSEETIERLRKSHMGKKHTTEQRKKISDALKGRVLSKGFLGRHLSAEHKKKVSLAMATRFISEETKKKMSASAKLRWKRGSRNGT